MTTSALPPKNLAQHKDSCGYAVTLGGQFLTLASAGVAFIVGLIFAGDGAPASLPPWTLKTALALFGVSIVLGWMFHMNVVAEINKSDSYDVYCGAPQWLSMLQILCCLAGVG